MADTEGNHGNDTNGYYINIEDYYDKIHRTTWARRTAGLFAGATLGALYGAVVGAAAAFVPYVLGAIGVAGAAAVALPVFSAVATSVALFAGISAMIGMAITADVSANAASSAVGLEEKERREKLEQQMNGKCTGPDCPPPPSLEPPHTLTPSEKGPPLFSWKVAAVTAPLFAAFGALIAFNPFTSALVFSHAPFAGAIAAESAAAVVTSSSVFGMFGAFMGMKTSLLTNKLANFYYKLVTGQLFEKEPEKAMTPQVASQITQERATERTVDEPARPARVFAVDTGRFSLQEVLDRSKKPGPDQEMALLR